MWLRSFTQFFEKCEFPTFENSLQNGQLPEAKLIFRPPKKVKTILLQHLDQAVVSLNITKVLMENHKRREEANGILEIVMSSNNLQNKLEAIAEKQQEQIRIQCEIIKLQEEADNFYENIIKEYDTEIEAAKENPPTNNKETNTTNNGTMVRESSNNTKSPVKKEN